MSSTGNGSGPFARVEAIVDAWNRGDRATAAAWFEPSSRIIDNTPPYLFSGLGAVEAWEKAYAASLTAEQSAAEFSLRLLSPEIVETDADRAYVVVRAEWAGNDKADPAPSPGVITVVLDQSSGQWLVASWVWTPR